VLKLVTDPRRNLLASGRELVGWFMVYWRIPRQ